VRQVGGTLNLNTVTESLCLVCLLGQRGGEKKTTVLSLSLSNQRHLTLIFHASRVALHREELFGGPFSKDLPPELLGTFDVGGSEQRRDDALAAVRFPSPKTIEKAKSTCTRHLFLWPHFIIRQLEMPFFDPGSKTK